MQLAAFAMQFRGLWMEMADFLESRRPRFAMRFSADTRVPMRICEGSDAERRGLRCRTGV